METLKEGSEGILSPKVTETETQKAKLSRENANYTGHRVDAGMVEVSLAFAALVSGGTVIGTHDPFPNTLIPIVIAILLVAANFIGLWFLAAYCVQQNIVEGSHEKAIKEFNVILDFLKGDAGIYRVLAFCQISLMIISFGFLFT